MDFSHLYLIIRQVFQAGLDGPAAETVAHQDYFVRRGEVGKPAGKFFAGRLRLRF